MAQGRVARSPKTDKSPKWTSLSKASLVWFLIGKHRLTNAAEAYFSNAIAMGIERFAYASRSHWGVENKLHWSLDVVFHEDDSRIRKGHAPENMTVIRKIALNLLAKESSIGSKKA